VQILLAMCRRVLQAVLNLPHNSSNSGPDGRRRIPGDRWEGLAELRSVQVKYERRVAPGPLLQHGNLHPDTTIDPVVAKWDCVAAAGQDAV